MTVAIRTLKDLRTHPQASALLYTALMMALFTGIATFGDSDVNSVHVWLIGLCIIGASRSVSHLPGPKEDPKYYAFLFGFGCGLVLSVVIHPKLPEVAFFWFAIASSIFVMGGAALFDQDKALSTRGYTELPEQQPIQWVYPTLILTSGIALTLFGAGPGWICLTMAIGLNAVPEGRKIDPAYDRPALRWTLRIAPPLLAGAAAYSLTQGA